MPISFTCPHCGLQTNVADEYAGKSGPCVRCGNTITVPGGSGVGVPLPPAGSGLPTLVIVLVVALVTMITFGGILVALFLPAVGAAREAARRSQCTNNLKQIALAMHNYHDAYKCFPPAVITDRNGRPMRSWRVALLPFLEQSALYKAYKSDEPWDGPNNRALGNIAIPTYRCPSDPSLVPTETNYVMIVGKGAFGGLPNEATRMSDIRDGASNTIMIVEVTGSGIPWMEPRDLSVEEIQHQINDGSGKWISSKHPGGVNVALCDGSVRFLAETIDRKILQSLIDPNDGTRVDVP
jgi:prepilin-type processing-associated H-X9-DG protein